MGDYPDPSSGFFSGVPTLFTVSFILFAVLFVAAIARGVVYRIRRRCVLRDAGLDPMLTDVQMQARAARGTLVSPPPAPGQLPVLGTPGAAPPSAAGQPPVLGTPGAAPPSAAGQLPVLGTSGAVPPSSPPPGPDRTIERKLAHLQDLFDRGVITSDELHEARLKIISE